jgi:hypothetical protein
MSLKDIGRLLRNLTFGFLRVGQNYRISNSEDKIDDLLCQEPISKFSDLNLM